MPTLDKFGLVTWEISAQVPNKESEFSDELVENRYRVTCGQQNPDDALGAFRRVLENEYGTVAEVERCTINYIRRIT